MPIYEYRCNGCGRRVQLFFRSFSAVQSGSCPHCGSTDLARAPSRVAIVRSESARQEILADPDVKQRMLELGITAKASTPQEISARLKSDIDKWQKVIDRAGIPKQ